MESVGVVVLPTVNSSCPPCPLCQKTFLARRSLLRHLRNVHERNDHKELVPSNKAGHDANRIRNKLGRFVKVGEDPNAHVTTRADENALESSTPSSRPTSVANTSMKPSKKRLAQPIGVSLPEIKRPALMNQPMFINSQHLNNQNMLIMRNQLGDSAARLMGASAMKPAVMQLPLMGATNFGISPMINQGYQPTPAGYPMMMMQPLIQTIRPPAFNYMQPMASMQQIHQLRPVY